MNNSPRHPREGGVIRTCRKEKNAYFIFRLGLDVKIYFVPVLLSYCNRALNEREKGGVFVMQSSVPLTLFGLETV